MRRGARRISGYPIKGRGAYPGGLAIGLCGTSDTGSDTDSSFVTATNWSHKYLGRLDGEREDFGTPRRAPTLLISRARFHPGRSPISIIVDVASILWRRCYDGFIGTGNGNFIYKYISKNSCIYIKVKAQFKVKLYYEQDFCCKDEI